MDSTTESTGTPTHLSTVKDLLTELDQMKNKGIGARDRLDFILEHGAELMEEFDLQDAFDVEARARSKRMAQLNDLRSSMTNTEQLWGGGPLLDDVKEAATKLFSHLHRFLKDALSRERKSEIDMLAQVWEWAPDIRWLYPWLTAWKGPIYRPNYHVRGETAHGGMQYPTAPVPEEPSEEVKELAQRKEALYKEATPKAELDRIARDIELVSEEKKIKEMRKLWPDVPEKYWDELERNEALLEREHNAELERLNNRVLESQSAEDIHREASETKAKWEKETRELDSRIPAWKGKIIHQDEAGNLVVPKPKVEPTPEPEPEPVDHILHDAWTTAFRELTLDDWQFTKEMPWHSGAVKGKVLLWHLQTGEARVEMNKTAGGTTVSLRILKDGKLWKHEAELDDDEVKELHMNPIPFVKKTLDD
jgi:hypothetical protein